MDPEKLERSTDDAATSTSAEPPSEAPPNAIPLDTSQAETVPEAIPLDPPPSEPSESSVVADGPPEPIPAAVPVNNSLAIASFVLSLGGIQFPPMALLGLILGLSSLRQIWANKGQGGYSFALAGVLIGAGMTGFFILVTWLILAVAGGAALSAVSKA